MVLGTGSQPQAENIIPDTGRRTQAAPGTAGDLLHPAGMMGGYIAEEGFPFTFINSRMPGTGYSGEAEFCLDIGGMVSNCGCILTRPPRWTRRLPARYESAAAMWSKVPDEEAERFAQPVRFRDAGSRRKTACRLSRLPRYYGAEKRPRQSVMHLYNNVPGSASGNDDTHRRRRQRRPAGAVGIYKGRIRRWGTGWPPSSIPGDLDAVRKLLAGLAA